jgi:hypothetical protein
MQDRYFGDEQDPLRPTPEPMLDLDALEERQALEALQGDDTQACGSGFLDFDLLEAAFAADEGQPVVFRCRVCRCNPVDPLRGQAVCSWCASQGRP